MVSGRLKSSFEIRPLVLKRLLDQFPQHVGAFARKPEKIVRLYFVTMPGKHSDGLIKGRFVNAGNGPALDLKIGWRADGEEHIVAQQGALLVGQPVPEKEKHPFPFLVPKGNEKLPRAALWSFVNTKMPVANAIGWRWSMLGETAAIIACTPEQFKVSVGDQWLIIN